MTTISFSVISAQNAAPYTSAQRYNLNGQLTGTISPDPDGSGFLKYAATRSTYDARGLLVKVEKGYLQYWENENVKPENWSTYNFKVSAVQRFKYNDYGWKILESNTSSSDSKETLTLFSHDEYGRVKCKSVKMNKGSFWAAFAYPITNVCSVNYEGTDRITRYTYNEFDQIVAIEKAVDTPLQQLYVQNIYDGGLKTDTIDANGNLAHMEYDEFGRLEKWFFPDKVNVGGGYSTSDYEEYSYDNNNNRLTLKKRDNVNTIAYEYNDLNQLIKKDWPGGTTKDVFYKNDLRGLQLSATFGSHNGQGIRRVYNGFTHLKAEHNNTLGTSFSIYNDYDANGNRIKLTHPDGKYFRYDYDGLNRLTTIKENSTASNKILTTQKYDLYSRPYRLERANNVHTSITFDNISRLKTIAHGFSSYGDQAFYQYEYNPASQLTKLTLSNDRYREDNNTAGITGEYEVNGLNQYTCAGANHGAANCSGGDSITHDDNGNTTYDGYRTFGYDVENRLVSASLAGLTYDPIGRLTRYSVYPNPSKTFIYDGDALIAEYSGNVLTNRYVHGFGTDAPLVEYEGSAVGSANRLFLHTNHQSSVIAASNSSGNAEYVNRYDNYGVPNAGNQGRFGYTGQLYLSEFRLNYFKARMYNPKLGRFMQTDPIGYKDDMNLYGYVGNDPMNNNDPTGKFANFIAKFALDVVLEVAVQVATGEPVDVGAAMKDAALGMLNPAKTAQKLAKLGKAVAQSKGASKVATRTCCFVAGTQVLTENGYKNIEDVKLGEKLWAKNTDTGEQDWKPVTKVFIEPDRDIFEIKLRGGDGFEQKIQATDDHPFYVVDQGWKTTAELKVGDKIETDGYGAMEVISVIDENRQDLTYNFTVAEFHTYYITEKNVLVHNCGDTVSVTTNEAFRKAKEANGIPRSAQPNSTIKPRTEAGDAAGLDSRNVKQFEFTNGKGESVTIRQDKPTTYPDGGSQPSHFNAGPTGEKLKQHHNIEN